jgi:transposase
MAKKESAEKAVRDIRRKTRRRFSAEEKIRIVIEGLLLPWRLPWRRFPRA